MAIDRRDIIRGGAVATAAAMGGCVTAPEPLGPFTLLGKLQILDLSVAIENEAPFGDMIAEFKNSGDGRAIRPAHFAGITREYCQIEKLANLEKLPRAHGFYVSCLPVKIKGEERGVVPGGRVDSP